MLKITFLTLLVLAVAVFAEHAGSPAYALDTQTSKIIGVILDENNARIAGAAIKIESASFNRQLRSSDEGKFEVELPAGEYRITVEQEGFHKFEVSPFRAEAGVCELLNVHMEVKPARGLLKVG